MLNSIEYKYLIQEIERKIIDISNRNNVLESENERIKTVVLSEIKVDESKNTNNVSESNYKEEIKTEIDNILRELDNCLSILNN